MLKFNAEIYDKEKDQYGSHAVPFMDLSYDEADTLCKMVARRPGIHIHLWAEPAEEEVHDA